LKPRGSTVMKMNRKAISLIMITLLATSATGLGLIPAQAAEPRRQAAETLLSVLENSHGKVSALFDSVSAEGDQIPEEAQEQLQAATQLREQAQAHFEAGEYEECIEKATEALNAYGKAAAKLHQDEDDEEPDDDEAEENLGLFTAVEKAREHLEKLLSIASDLESQSIDVTEAKDPLDQAEAALDSAEDKLNQGNFEAAEELLEDARSLMGQATGRLQSLSNPKKKEKTEQFIEQTRSRVQQLEEKMLMILSKYGVSEEDTQALMNEFQGIKAALEEMDVDEDDQDDVVHQLKHLVKESHEIGKDHDEIEDETIEKLKDIGKLEAKLNRYRERIRELERLGYNTDELTGLFQEAEGLITEATNKLGEGDKKSAEDLLEEAEDLLDDLDDMIDDVEDETDDDKGKGADEDDEEEPEDEPEQDDDEDDDEEEEDEKDKGKGGSSSG
jgi:tetratricopeptide (TPR) repeat protein